MYFEVIIPHEPGLLLVWAPKISGASSQSYPFVLNKFLLLRRETDKAVIVTKVFIDITAARTFRKLTSPQASTNQISCDRFCQPCTPRTQSSHPLRIV
jgi:hypothetical protein